jgi:hypothetical protein
MPKKIQECSLTDLLNVSLPNHASTYTVISHKFVVDYAKQQLVAAGFNILSEEYKATSDGQIAQGIYKLDYNGDPELNMMFAWTNSYNKQVKFKCLIGAYIIDTDSVMVCGDIGSWTRKHMGTADIETKETIDNHINNALMYYDQLLSDKKEMENITMNKRKQAQMLGILFAEYQILTTEQSSMVRQQMDKPKHFFKNIDSLWAFYNFVTIALQHSHPKTWIEDQRVLHYFISSINNFPKAVVQLVDAPVIQNDLIEEEAEVISEQELAHDLYGVDNDNIEVSFPIIEDNKENLELEEVQVLDNQVVPNDSNFDAVLHHSEEIIEDVIEVKEEPLQEHFEESNIKLPSSYDLEDDFSIDINDEILSDTLSNDSSLSNIEEVEEPIIEEVVNEVFDTLVEPETEIVEPVESVILDDDFDFEITPSSNTSSNDINDFF